MRKKSWQTTTMYQMNESANRQLLYFFRRNGCFRVPNKHRRKKEGQKYKKGYEIRFVAKDEEELSKMRSLLRKAGLKFGKSYSKGSQLVLPIYGKEFYEKFRNFVSNRP